MAFLYPRYAAVLADEMGLGKTMQAITAIRLLLRSGEVRSVLLICPKPLVTNWQREFHLWAPEIPLTIIEGDQPRRHWQWRLRGAGEDRQLRAAAARPRRVAGRAAALRPGRARRSPADQEPRRQHGRRSPAVISRTRSWALTGTPVENSADDLVGIFEFLSPGYLTPA